MFWSKASPFIQEYALINSKSPAPYQKSTTPCLPLALDLKSDELLSVEALFSI